MKVQGSVALVTGANRGIGRSIVEELLARGAKRVYAAARNADSLKPILTAGGGRVTALQLDVTKSEDIRAAAGYATDVDLLINNAGVVDRYGAPLSDKGWLDSGRVEMEVNVFGPLEMTQAFAPILAANGGGAIIYLNSLAGLVGFPNLASYSMSKAALHSLTQVARTVLAGQKTKVVGVYAGPVDTDMAAQIPFQKTPPADVARMILDGVENGVEDVFPDPMSQAMGNAYLQNPKGAERQVAQMSS
ncbi:MAG TPA: SDR family oxidoreductase [Thermoanaerobaculia bacterium]|nr:SDR family oxidoreductase [Thermoanaerobaculia bacterium]